MPRLPAKGLDSAPQHAHLAVVVDATQVAAALWAEGFPDGVVAHLPRVPPVYFARGQQALQRFADLNPFEQPTVALVPEVLGILVREGAAGVAVSAPDLYAEPETTFPRSDLASALPHLLRAMDALLDTWAKRGIFSLDAQVRLACWRLVTRLILGVEAGESQLADFTQHFHAEHVEERAAAARRYLAWLDAEAQRIAQDGQPDALARIAPRGVAQGRPPHAQRVRALNDALVTGMRIEAPITALLHRLCRDNALFAQVRTEVQALPNQRNVEVGSRAPCLAQLIADAARRTAATPLLHGRLKTAARVAGIALPKGAHVVATTPVTSMASPFADLVWAFACRLIARFDLRPLDASDVPERTASGFTAPRGGFVRFGLGVLQPNPPAWRDRPPTIPVASLARGRLRNEVEPVCRVPERGTHSILEILRDRYQQTPGALVTTLLDAKGRQVRALTYRELVERSTACAARLRAAGLQDGGRVALVYPPDTDEFLVGFFGCLIAGAIAVPVAPPDPRAIAVAAPRFAHIVSDCVCRFALTTRFYDLAVRVGRAWNRTARAKGSSDVPWPTLTWIRTDALEPLPPSSRLPIPSPPADKIAYLQYTSGSTSTPKGVMISHGNVLHNVEAIRRQATVTPRSVLVGWVPLFHDMGLVGGPLNAIYTGAHLVFFSPLAFLQNPRLWLETIHRYRGTHTESPNFAYEFLLRRIEGDALEGLDLSCLTHALFGGEVMRHGTFERMAERLHAAGLRPEAMRNVLGAAEATLFLAGAGDGYPPLLSLQTDALERTGRAVPCSPGPEASTLLGCRIPPDACDLRVVDPQNRIPLPDGVVGEIWLSSPSTAQGYWGHPADENDATFRARIPGEGASGRAYLRTGDIGFIDRDVLYICGRHKERMTLDGRDIYPMDLEVSLLNAHRAIRPGCVAAFSVEEDGRESLVIVAELKAKAVDDAQHAAAAIADVLARRHRLVPRRMLFVPTGALPKTSSGKLQRYKARELHLAGRLRPIFAQVAAE